MINDTYINPFTSKLPITYNLNIRSYLGVPVFYKNGDMYGTLCVMDSKPTDFTNMDIEVLRKYSNLFSYVVELEKRANYDSLTNLYSRSYFYNNCDSLEDKGTLMLLDLDGFKKVNDEFGHGVGDIVLREVGKRIKQCLTQNDIGVRLGGDEFVLLFPNLIDNSLVQNMKHVIREMLSDWKNFNYDINISASIGIVKYPCDGTNLQTLLKKADTSMYKAKKEKNHS